MTKKNIWVAVACLLLGACASSNPDKQMAPVGETVCEAARPEFCSMDYLPVCGTHQDGSVKTYSNACGACSNPEVTSWIEDACLE